MTTNLNQKLRLKGTVYATFRDQHALREMELSEWMEGIKNGAHKSKVELYRKDKAEGLMGFADQVKRSLNAFLCAGVCSDERKEGSEIEASNVFLGDWDRHEEAWAEEVIPTLYEFKWIFAAHQTVNHGIRVFFGMPQVEAEYFKLYAQVALEKLDAIIGVKHDKACINRMRLSAASYDPKCWCRPAEECTETVPFTDAELAKIKRQIARAQKKDQQSCVPLDFDMHEVPLDDSRNLTDAEVSDLLMQFMDLHPYVAHHHHESLLEYGTLARYKGFTSADVTELVDLLAREFPVDGYDAAEVQRNVFYGYLHPRKHLVSKESSPSNSTEEDDFEIDDHENDATILEYACPYFSHEVYQKLPQVLKKLLGPARNRRQRDFLLASLLTALSAVMEGVNCHLRGKTYSANFAFCGVSPAGTGKSIAMIPSLLLKKIEKYVHQEYNQKKETWQRKHRLWMIENRKAEKEDRDPNWSLDPGPAPHYVPFMGSAQTSNSALIDNLANASYSIIQFASEMDVMNAANRADFGQLQTTYRMALSNETISKSYKCDLEPIVIENPRLTLVVTGTIEHFIGLVQSVDNGNLSRWAILSGPTSTTWDELTVEKDDMDHIDEDTILYNETADTILDMFLYLKDHPTDVYFHPNQFETLNGFFSFALSELKRLKHPELTSLVTRGQLLALHIATTLSGIRKFLERGTEQRIYIHEDDFSIAMEMARVFISHASQLSTILPKPNYGRKHMKPIDPADKVLPLLPDEFTTAEILQLMQKEANIGRSSTFNKLNKWKEEGRVETISNGKYRKLKEGSRKEGSEKGSNEKEGSEDAKKA